MKIRMRLLAIGSVAAFVLIGCGDGDVDPGGTTTPGVTIPTETTMTETTMTETTLSSTTTAAN